MILNYYFFSGSIYTVNKLGAVLGREEERLEVLIHTLKEFVV